MTTAARARRGPTSGLATALDEAPLVAIDLNPGDTREEGGGESLGRTASGRAFDFDFDGSVDLIVGYNHRAYDVRARRASTVGTARHLRAGLQRDRPGQPERPRVRDPRAPLPHVRARGDAPEARALW